MRNDSSPNMTSETEATMPHDMVEGLLTERLANSIAPISIEIDCEALKQWAMENQNERFRHQNVIKELKIWSQFLKNRPVTRFWLNHPFTIVDAPGLTELIYALGQNLKVAQGTHGERAISLPCEAINRQSIALLLGLEINHVQINLQPHYSIENAKAAQDLLREFQFPYVSYELTVNNDPTENAMGIMEALSFLEPATVTLLPSPLNLDNLERFAPMLMKFGYYFRPPNHIIKFHSPLHQRPPDTIRLGPNQISDVSNLTLHALTEANTYRNYLRRELLPIGTVKTRQ